MALLFCDSFDHYATAQLTQKWNIATAAFVTSGIGRNGTAGLDLRHNSGRVEKNLPTNHGTLIVGFAFKRNTSGTSGLIVASLYDGGTEQVSIRMSATGTLVITRGGTVLQTGTTFLVIGAFYHIEMKVTFADAGTWEVRLNGTAELSGSGDTQASANAYANILKLGPLINFDNQQTQLHYDDLYVCDTTAPNNDFLGDVRVQALFPNAVGASSQWTPSGGAVSNFTMVDEATPNDDTDYNSSATPGQIDTYGFSDLTATSAVIRAVQLLMRVRKDDAGSRTVAPVVRHAGVNYTGTAQSVLDSYTYLQQRYDTNPGTGATWALSHVNDAEFGINEVT